MPKSVNFAFVAYYVIEKITFTHTNPLSFSQYINMFACLQLRGVCLKAPERIVTAGNHPAKVTGTADLAKALEGADGVLSTIQTGD